MAANSPYKTLSDIRLAIIKDAKESTSTTFVSLVDRWINEGHEQVTLRKKRDWLDKQFVVQMNGDTQATCTVTNGSPTVTFTPGTTFPSGVELQFNSPTYSEVYNVLSTASNVVTLEKPFLGSTNTAASGIVFQPSVILDGDIRAVYQMYTQHRGQPLTDVGPQQMRAIQEAGKVTLDYPQYFTLFGQDADGDRRALVYPYPSEDYTLYIDANTYVPVLSAATDEPVIPMQYRQILYHYGLYKLFLYHRNDQKAADAYSAFSGMLARIDGEMRAELDFPQIVPVFPRRTRRGFVGKFFDPNMRDES